MMITSEVRGNQLFSTEDGMWRRPFEASASSMGPVPGRHRDDRTRLSGRVARGCTSGATTVSKGQDRASPQGWKTSESHSSQCPKRLVPGRCRLASRAVSWLSAKADGSW